MGRIANPFYNSVEFGIARWHRKRSNPMRRFTTTAARLAWARPLGTDRHLAGDGEWPLASPD